MTTSRRSSTGTSGWIGQPNHQQTSAGTTFPKTTATVSWLYGRLFAWLTGNPAAARVEHFIRDQNKATVAHAALSLLGSSALVVAPFAIRNLIDGWLLRLRTSGILLPVFLILGAFVLSAAVSTVRYILIGYFSEKLALRIQRDLHQHAIALPFPHFARARHGDVVTLFTIDTAKVQTAAAVCLPAIATMAVELVVSGVVAYLLQWRLAFAVAVIGVIPLVLLRLVRGRVRAISRVEIERHSRMVDHLVELTGPVGALHMRAFRAQSAGQEEFERLGSAISTAARTRVQVFARLQLIAAGSSVLATMTVIGFGVWLTLDQTMTVGTFVAFLSVLLLAFRSIAGFANLRTQLFDGESSLIRILAFLDIPLEPAPAADRSNVRPLATADRPHPPKSTPAPTDPAAPSPESTPRPPVHGDLVLENVSYSYAPDVPAPSWAVRSVDIVVERSEMVAVVGFSGAGKTTLCHLASGLLTPTSGRVLLGGRDAAGLSPTAGRAAVGLVSQEPFIQRRTVAENLRFGNPAATTDELWAALEATGLVTLVRSLPEGIHTPLGHSGYQISGGERQRLSIARVLVQNPRTVILDEATSNLDTLTEDLLRASLERLLADRSCLVVAHRATMTVAADRIYVLENGTVMEAGPHDRLIRSGGIYARLTRGPAERTSRKEAKKERNGGR
ncbi:ABC transporter ATP-binding protein [Candidatus Protofrankia californiensis]|uniref:ABC transporter ATP-binding protein n=1 Tax=Candidatus Protofrankia californiensis TaxID=1839754 RepID=UPI001040E5E6|nr:ABC transporter ATP-binding protein [Candidatus Protofrankia californiensis]